MKDPIIIDENQTDLEEAINLSKHNTEIIEIQKIYGDNLPYQRDRVINEAKFYMNQGAIAMLQLGKSLVSIKENETVAAFTKIVEDDFNLSKSAAYRLMQAATKFLNLDKKNFPALGNLGLTKLFELVTQDDEQLEALTEGGTVAGLTLDEMDKMTTRELKAALKEAREDKDAVGKVLADKTGKIEKLEVELEKAKKKNKSIKLTVDEERIEAEKTHKHTLNEVIAELSISVTKLFELKNSADVNDLSIAFFREMALAISNQIERIDELTQTLPSDTAPVDTSWLDEADHE